MSHVYGWHFLPEDRRLGYNDGRIVEAGKTYTVSCNPVLCESGLHWSERAIDALSFNRGPIACRVRSVTGHPVVKGGDKVVSTARHVVTIADASDILRRLSRNWALKVFSEHFSRDDTKVSAVFQWLDSGVESLREAARSTAFSTAHSAANLAAYSAAISAADSAAKSAADSAVNWAARSAEYSAAYWAANSVMNSELEAALLAAMGLKE